MKDHILVIQLLDNLREDTERGLNMIKNIITETMEEINLILNKEDENAN